MEKQEMPETFWLIALVSVVAIGLLIFHGKKSPKGSAAAVAQQEAAASLPPRQLVDKDLFEAASQGDIARVTTALRNGVDPSLRNAEWLSPLGIAIKNGQFEVVRTLLAAGVDPNWPVHNDEPALFFAVAYGQTALVPDLISTGARLEFSHPAMGSALAMSVLRGDFETTSLLLKAGIPVDLRNAGGARPLHVAALTGKKELVELLMANGASIDCPNFQAGTPLRAAAANGHAEIVRLLLAAGAAPSPMDAFEQRPIDYAKEGGHEEVVKLLAGAERPSTAQHECPKEIPLSWMLPPREDATLKLVIQAREEQMKMMSAAASSLEAPSMMAVVRSVAGRSFHVDFSVEDAPDPRLPIRPVAFALWTYGQPDALSNDARPAVPKPPDSVIEQVVRVAECPYLLQSWSDAAAKAAQILHPEELNQVLAAMVHPPAPPEYIEPWEWHFRIQVAAALIASFLGTEPWSDSARRKTLEDVLDGPIDWTTTAVTIALLDVGRRDPSATSLITDALLRTARRPVDPPTYQHAIRPAARALLELPAATPEIVQEMAALLQEGAIAEGGD